MYKKIFGLLFLPYLTFMFLEGCWNDQCDRKETRNITNIEMTHIKNTSSIIENIILDMDYESYFVNNYKPDLIRKAYAKSVAYDPCFEGFSNPIESISISSANDFNLDYLAGNEINSLFKHNYSDNNLANYEFNPYSVYEIDNQIIIYNVSTPSLDSIHTLYFNIYCADGKTYLDTLNNVNLNRTNNFYYY